MSAGAADGSGAMFDGIAPRYDRLNRLMSLGLDRGWRRKLVKSLNASSGEVLDVATGTGDVALRIARQWPKVRVTGLDPSVGMLDVGRKKVANAGMDDRIELVEGDAQALPFEDGRFAATCISFGIRNVPDRRAGLREMLRVTRSGGRICVLELGEPDSGLLAPLVRFHIRQIVPRLGAALSGAGEYRYLQTSVAAFPSPSEFRAMMEKAGAVDISVRPLGFGGANLFVGTAP